MIGIVMGFLDGKIPEVIFYEFITPPRGFHVHPERSIYKRG